MMEVHTKLYRRAPMPDDPLDMSAMSEYAYIATSIEEAQRLAKEHPTSDIYLREEVSVDHGFR